MQDNEIIKAIDTHAKDFSLKVTTIGQLAVQSRHAYDRIKSGSAHRDVKERLVEWLSDDRAAREKTQIAS